LVRVAYSGCGAGAVGVTVHNVVEKQEILFSFSVNTGSSMSCTLHVLVVWIRSLHQSSALTNIGELFTFAASTAERVS